MKKLLGYLSRVLIIGDYILDAYPKEDKIGMCENYSLCTNFGFCDNGKYGWIVTFFSDVLSKSCSSWYNMGIMKNCE